MADNVLQEALKICTGDRNKDYGDPRANHQRTADYWEVFFRHRKPGPITPREVCWLNVLQKISRDQHCPKRDNAVDVAGWAFNSDEVSEENEPVVILPDQRCRGCGSVKFEYSDPVHAMWRCSDCCPTCRQGENKCG